MYRITDSMSNQTKRTVIAVVFLVNVLVGAVGRAELAERIDEILKRPANRKVLFSIEVVEAGSGRVVYQHDARELMIPASNMKIITTAAALHYLGPDYTYVTTVGLAGDTLVIIGSGDPLLGDAKTDSMYGRKAGWIFADIAGALTSKGVTVINDIIVDTTVFDDQRVHPSWPADQLNRWYAAEVCGLNYNTNCVDIIARNVGGKVIVSTEPRTSFIELINEITPISSGTDAIACYRTSQPNKLSLNGRCKTKATLADVAIERPAAFFAFLLAENLAQRGIKTSGRFIEMAFQNRGSLVRLTEFTTSIHDCLARCNKNSLGLVAEALVKTIAAEKTPDKKNGSWKGGTELISQYLSDLGLDDSQFYIDDGSGLSRQNELSAHAITKVLRSVYGTAAWRIYRDSLAVGGVDGTIAKYFYRPKYKGRILGKTGYLEGVRAFSGVCITKKGDYIFSILANNANGLTRGAINDIAVAIIDEAEP